MSQIKRRDTCASRADQRFIGMLLRTQVPLPEGRRS
jgi:hypothetical protein